MVLSSITPDGRPQGAVVEFAETDKLEIIFDTYVHFRKFENLNVNRNVALVFDDRKGITVQYEGTVRLLDSKELEPYVGVYLAKLPEAYKYVQGPETRWFMVTPQWIRYTDINHEPWDIRELPL